MKEYRIKVNTWKESKIVTDLRNEINKEVIGQDRAVRRLLRATASYYSGLKDPRKPIGGFVFAGPTGVGKTWLAKVFARHFLGGKNRDKDYLTRIDCSGLMERHEVSRLTGAPPGYIGYNDPPKFVQEFLEAYAYDVKVGKDKGLLIGRLRQFAEFYFKSLKAPPNSQLIEEITDIQTSYVMSKPYRSVVLFDEIEKAHSDIWNILLQIMQEGELQLGKSGETTKFADSVIILTSNIGQKEIQEILRMSPPKNEADFRILDDLIYKAAKKRIKATFPPELFKRLDLIVFRPLEEEHFEKILNNFLLEEQERLNQITMRITRLFIRLNYTPAVKQFLLEKGVDVFYGARTLQAVVEKYIRSKISNGIASGEIRSGDDILIDEIDGEIKFTRKPRKRGQNAIKHVVSLKETIKGEGTDLTLLPESSEKKETAH